MKKEIKKEIIQELKKSNEDLLGLLRVYNGYVLAHSHINESLSKVDNFDHDEKEKISTFLISCLESGLQNFENVEKRAEILSSQVDELLS